jgi:co-chaperonin GroES (HSP10)
MVNESGLAPKGYAVLVRPYEPEMTTKGGIIIPESKRDQMLMLDQRAVVVAVGPMAWSDETAQRAVPGDKVLISKYAGNLLQGTADGKQYRMVLDRDIFCGIEAEGADIRYV